MHGIVHKTLKEYVVAKTDDETWNSIADRAAVEPTLYLPVGHYEDAEIDAILETLASRAVQDRPSIERDFGRRLAPELRSTFGAHFDDEADLLSVLASLESIVTAVDRTTDETTVPDVSGRRIDERTVEIAYESARGYCDLAHGILEGLVAEYDADATVAKRTCTRNGADSCTFRVVLE
jgi:predicted hydrocarbon binding protein